MVEVDWVENAEGLQAAHSFDYLLNCWVEQWPEGVKGQENAPPEELATREEMDTAIAATRLNCEREMLGRIDQIRIDLLREGVEPRDSESRAERQLDSELEDMFNEHWSRL